MDNGGNTFEVTMKLIEPKSLAMEER